jgi:hypothetical protein
MNEIERQMAVRDHMVKIVTARAVLTAAETRAQVLGAKASRPDGERFREHANEALSAAQEKAKELEELETDPIMGGPARDPEGTRSGLADIHGNYAPNQRVANTGGVGVQGSNSTEGGDVATEPEEAGTVIEGSGAAIVGHGGRAEVLADEGDDEGDEAETPRRRGRKARKGRALRQTTDNTEE